MIKKATTSNTDDLESHEGKFLVSVVPLTRIPLTRDQSFFYTSTEAIPIGSLVTIPIGKRYLKGVVSSVHPDFERAGGMQLKPIADVITPNALTHDQIALCQMISDYYFCPLGIVLKHTIPDIVRPRKTAHDTSTSPLLPINISPRAQKKCDQIRKLLNDSEHVYLQTTDASESNISMIYLLQETLLHTQGQILILVPEHTHIPLMQQLLHDFFPDEITTTLTSNMTKGNYSQSWQRIRNHTGEDDVRIVIASRVGVFAPFEKLSLVIVTQAHDIAYKQWDMQPRYDARQVVKFLSHIYKCATLLMSPAPTVEQFQRYTQTQNMPGKNQFPHTLLTLPTGKKITTHLTDMRIEYNEVNEKRYTKNHPILARTATYAIKKAYESGGQSLLFINRSGKNAFSVCLKCAAVLRCPQCERALIEKSAGNFNCNHCAYKTPVFPRCPACNNLQFRSIGLGTQAIQEQLCLAIPGAHITRIDKDISRKLLRDDLIKTLDETDILIGTQMIAKGTLLPRLRLAVVVDFDTLVGGYDYHTHEQALGHIMSLRCALTENPARQTSSARSTGAQLHIQTYEPENELARVCTQSNIATAWEDFSLEELSMREILSYPPFVRIIKLTYRHNFAQTGRNEAQKIYSLIDSTVDGITVSEPHDPLVSKVRTQHRTQIIIKIPRNQKSDNQAHSAVPQKLREILHTLDAKWAIDVDPVSLS